MSRRSVVTAQRTSDLLRVKRYADVQELRWNEDGAGGSGDDSAFQVAHWGARMRSDVFRGFNGYLIDVGQSPDCVRRRHGVYEHFKQLRSSRPIDLAIMPIGAYDPWIHVHCNPEQALCMANDAGAEFILPVHHQTFQLSREPRREPIERLVTAAGQARSESACEKSATNWRFSALSVADSRSRVGL